MKKDQKEYDVFISYSRKDYVDEHDDVIPDNIVSKVIDSLKDAGINYWIDEEANYASESWAKFIFNCIKSSKIIVFIASKNANQSEWTRREIATANEFKKPILPFRIDDSLYDEDVFMRLVTLQYIAHYKNPDTSLNDLVVAVKDQLEKIKEKEEEERKKKEEELKRRQAEEEERKRKEQQQIEAIRLAYSKLNNEETKIEVNRSDLLIEAQAKVKDPAEQKKLMNEIISSSPIRKESEQEIQQLRNKIESLENGLKSLQQEKDNLSVEIQKKKELVAEKEQLVTNIEQGYQTEVKRLKTQVTQQQSELTATKNRLNMTASRLAKTEEQQNLTEKEVANKGKGGSLGSRWWIHLIYVVLLIVFLCGWFVSNSKIKELQQQMSTNQATMKAIAPISTDTTITEPTAPRQVSNMEVNSKNLKKYLYTGQLNTDGEPDGEGTAVFPNKDTFEGTFVNGKLTKGRYTFAKDGTYFLGNFTENEEPDTAHGAYYHKNGENIN